MSATKRFYEGVAAAGMCPVNPETWATLDRLEQADQSIDWIGYCEYDYRGFDGKLYSQDCIKMESALTLVNLGLANDEIKTFVEVFGGFQRCDDCGRHGYSHAFPFTGIETLCVDCG